MSDRMSDAEFEHLQDQISYGDIKELQWLVDEARRARESEEVERAFGASQHRNHEAAIAKNATLRKALRDLYGLVDSGWLARDISHDHEDGWVMKQLRPVMILKEVSALVEDLAAPDKK
jgi:hypothetical protein